MTHGIGIRFRRPQRVRGGGVLIQKAGSQKEEP
jgi:hypothetical protein